MQSLCTLCLCGENLKEKTTTGTPRTQRLHRDLYRLSHTKFFAEVEPADFGVFGQFAWVSGAEDSALRHYIRTVSDAKRLAHVVIGDQDTNTTISQVEYYVLNVINRLWIDSGEWLIEQDVLRFGCKSSGYFSAAPLTS